jgi:peptide deformylase
MSLQAVKAVEIGRGVTAAESVGSAVHDAIGYEEQGVGKAARFTGFTRERNNAGGIEGGISNGEDVVVRGYLKPISTLRRPLGSVSFATREPVKAAYERSDVCVVPAAGVAAEAMVALTVARLMVEKFGGDSLREMQRNFEGYCEQIRAYWGIEKLTVSAEKADEKAVETLTVKDIKIHEVVKWPNPVLMKPGAKVTVFDAKLKRLTEEMFESMYAAQGIGLAAPQIAISQRITVIDVSFKKNPEEKIVLINPEIVAREGKQLEEEGCLSLPEIREKVSRAAKVKVRAQDVTGEWFEVDGEELLARAMQHEIDHLDGVLFIDRLSRLKRDLVIRKIKKMIKNGEW